MFQAEFLEGKRLYSADAFSSSIGHFEAALEEYFSADAECRALCEGAYDYDGYNYMDYKADLFQSITGEQQIIFSTFLLSVYFVQIVFTWLMFPPQITTCTF